MLHLVNEISKTLAGDSAIAIRVVQPSDDIFDAVVTATKLPPPWICERKCHFAFRVSVAL
jgi:hypothetical protein